MSIREIIIELVLLVGFLSAISGVCMWGQVALDASITAVVLGGLSYVVTLFSRASGDPINTDKHIH